jgi:AraC family transcriptional regulator, transcriptional activator of pobA
MSEKEKIFSLDLMYNDVPMPFVIKRLEGIDNIGLGIETNPHRHNYYSIIWPVAGEGKHIIDFREYPVARDHIFFVSPLQVHQVIITSALTGYVILFTSEFLDRNSIRNDFVSNLRLFRNSDETPPLPVDEAIAGKLKIFADNMMETFRNQADMFLEIAGAYLKLFLIECNGHCSLSPGSNLQSIEVTKTLVKNFKDLVERQFSTSHQVKDYAESLNVTPNYLNEVIKTSVNIPAKEFIQNRIILEAKRMAVFTEKSAKEIGFDLGFDDPSHFSKFFKTNAGQSIQAFRETLIY